MSYVTDEQLLAHIKAGKSIAWLAGATGWSSDELEAFADERGYVFGSNGVPRRSAVPLADLPARQRPIVLDQADLIGAAVRQTRTQEPSPPGLDETSTSGPPGGEAEQVSPIVSPSEVTVGAASPGGGGAVDDQAELIRRDALDDQIDLEFERALDAIEDLDWPALVNLGSRSCEQETRDLAGTITESVDHLRGLLIAEQEAADAIDLAACELRDAILTEEQLATQLEALRARIEELAPTNRVRAWATANGRSVSPKGPLPDYIRRDYLAHVAGIPTAVSS